MRKSFQPTHENIVDPDSFIRVKIYSKKPIFGRRQWHWNATHRNGNKMANGGEGYNNASDCEAAFRTIARDLRYAPIRIEMPTIK